jgi:hypothetical protein
MSKNANIKSKAKLIKDTRGFICQCVSLNNCYVIKVKDKVEKICTKRNLQILLSFIYNILIAFIVSAVFANDKGIKGHIKALFLRLGSYVQLFITLIATIYFFPNFFQFVKISFQTFSKGNFLQCGSTVLRTQNVM